MPSEKEQKYLSKIMSKQQAPAVAITHILETQPIIDNRLLDFAEAICNLQVGVAASIDEDGTVYLGKGLENGTNHYIMIYPPGVTPPYAYAYANQDKNDGKVTDCDELLQAVSLFRKQTELQ